ncbi:MAG: hypothetical protein N2561_05360 [Bacteroidetes bacterium]|nr:hypothetical protein [Rhodothermia bacterium]MCS7154891.1 hypothetical protein [Bacteroidota bacterium]MCX7906950.1 hypothetical protein [Bacteroidota bacterium]MDW8137686.1 hypothetical protein [Bacteroidota bacterium]MDW8285360.1 hypothetical protein [Bacteroidota bacterium]
MRRRYQADHNPLKVSTPYLADYLDGMLSPEETRWVEAQLQAHPALRRRLEALRRIRDQLRGLPPVKAPEDFEVRLRARIEAERALSAITPMPGVDRRAWVVGLAFVAGLLLSAMALWAWEETRRQTPVAWRFTYTAPTEVRPVLGGFEGRPMGSHPGALSRDWSWEWALQPWLGWRTLRMARFRTDSASRSTP